jgi:hypothetical protein
MHTHRRASRMLALAGTTTVMAVAPAAALARPATDSGQAPASAGQTAPTVVREIQTGGGDQTLALVISGTALLVALGGAGYAGRTGHRVGQPSH